MFVLLLACGLVTVSVASAQVGDVPPPPDTTAAQPLPFIRKWSGKITAGGMLLTGNVNRALATLRSDQSLASQLFELDAMQTYTYGEQDLIKKENDGLATLNVVLYPENVLQGLVFGTGEFSFSRRIDQRWQIGAGGKTVLMNGPDNVLKFSAVALYDYTRYTDATRSSLRFSARLKGRHELAPGRLRFLHETYFQPAFADLKDLRWRTYLSLEAPVFTHLSMGLGFRFWHETIVAATRKQNDLQWTVDVSYGW